MSRYHYDKNIPDSGYYEIEEHEGKWRYHWREVGLDEEFNDYGEWLDTRWEALLDAAEDWDAAGSGGRLGATLQGAATRARNADDDSGD